METAVNNEVVKGQSKERPLFMQNGNNAKSMGDEGGGGDGEISEFRRFLPQLFAVCVKNTVLFGYGMTLGFPTIVIPAIYGRQNYKPNELILDRNEISWFSSINLICVPLGCIFSGAFSQPIGKRRAMQIVNLPMLASWIVFHFASSVGHLYLALCLAGLTGGLMEAPILTYVAEVTEPKYRGTLSVLGSTCAVGGILMQFIFGSLMDWRTVAAINTAIPVLSIISLFFIPESPTWLITKGKLREAIRALQWLRGWVPEYKIEDEFNALYDQLITQPALKNAVKGVKEKHEQTFGEKVVLKLKLFCRRSFFLPFLLVSFTFFVGHFSGKTTLQTFAVQIFHALKSPIDKFHATVLLGSVDLLSTILSTTLVHVTGKRPLVLVSTVGVGVCFFSAATYAYLLNVIPGFAMAPQEHLPTVNNMTNVLGSLNNPILGRTQEMTTTYGSDITTLLPEIFEPKLPPSLNDTDESGSRIKRSNNTSDIEHIEFNPFDDLPIFEYDTNETAEVFPESESVPPEEKVPPVTEPNNVMPSQNQTKRFLTLSKADKNRLAWLPLILLLGAAFFAHLGIRMIPWILLGEVFPVAVRGTACGLVGAVGYCFGFLANKLFLQMLETMTMAGTFYFYSFVAIIGAVVLYFLLPETENKTLVEIEGYFTKPKPVGNVMKLQQIDRLEAIGRVNPTFVGEKAAEEKNSTTHL